MAVTKRKRRKPMTEEQRLAAAERLKIAREKRLRENPPQYKNVHPSILELTDDDVLCMKNIKQWIKTQKELVTRYKSENRSGVKGALAKQVRAEGYIRSMNNYLSSGVWTNNFYGEFEEQPMKWVCTGMAYDNNGNPKRTVGVYYPDIMGEWTKEMDEEYKNLLAKDKEL
jgi:hypothetical protein